MVKKVSIGEKLADVISYFVSTWTFVIIYTIAMLSWILLHVYGILHIDSLDFIKYNLFLSYFAGIQASIILMSNNKEIRADRIKREKDVKEINKKIIKLLSNIENLEDVIEDMDKENKTEKEV